MIKMSNGKITDLVDPSQKDIWERYGFKEVAEETKEMTYQEMKAKAKELGINTQGMKKEEIELLIAQPQAND